MMHIRVGCHVNPSVEGVAETRDEFFQLSSATVVVFAFRMWLCSLVSYVHGLTCMQRVMMHGVASCMVQVHNQR